MFEEEIGYILTDFKNGKINYAEAILLIEQLLLKQLNFTAYVNHMFESALQDKGVL